MRGVGLDSDQLAELSAEILAQGSSFSFRARGSSMSPSIQDSDILTIEPVQAAALRPGDVAFYRSAQNHPIAHRVVGRKQSGGQVVLLLRGDAQSGPGERVQADQVLGRVTHLQRGDRTLVLGKGARLLGLLWAWGYPVTRWLLLLVRGGKRTTLWLLQCLQARKAYRALARRLIGRRVSCRAAAAEDAPALARLYGYTRDPASGLDGRGHTWAASNGKRLVGAVTVWLFPQATTLYHGWWIWSLRVRARCRGAGIGEKLVRAALQKAAEEGANEVKLVAYEDDLVARALYAKMGFRQVPIAALDARLQQEARQGARRRIILSRMVSRDPPPS